ncbi:Eukaryotic aspartyl protease family protein [Raphanus sativus]|nr:Eukaryotic aspartyl protease family protein [Raphanus sativus]KAJ4910557.1 Eukaryotic aspartyl protease family protein [Raphanus sativus]
MLVRSAEQDDIEVQKHQMAEHCEKNCEKQCDYEIKYADLSSSLGVLINDEFDINLQNGSVADLCGYDQQGLLLNTLVKTDGIIGLSRATISLPSQLASRGIISNVVGHCFPSDLNVKAISSLEVI